MAKNSKKVAQSLSTAELIAEKEREIEAFNQQIAEKKAQLKAAENELVALNKQHKIEKLSDIGTIAEDAGISIDDLLAAFKDGTVLELIDKKDSASAKPATNPSPASVGNPTTPTTTPTT